MGKIASTTATVLSNSNLFCNLKKKVSFWTYGKERMVKDIREGTYEKGLMEWTYWKGRAGTQMSD